VGRTGAIEFMDMPAQMAASYQNYTRADITKLRGAGYYRPFMSLEDSVLDYISKYLAKEDPYF
jgi:ADP-L-glycero-D-manno-heptose 6-epimerase